MRYDDFRREHKAARQIWLDRQREQPVPPEQQAYEAIDREGTRFYQIAPHVTLRLDADMLGYHGGNPLRLEIVPVGRQGLNLEAADLRRAADAVAHVEAWVAGLVDELAPSGPWPAPGAVWSAEPAGAVAEVRRLHDQRDALIAEVRAFAVRVRDDQPSDPAGIAQALEDLLDRAMSKSKPPAPAATVDLEATAPTATDEAATRGIGIALRDAKRYQRLRVLGVAPAGTRHLEAAAVMCFTTLDAFVDQDLRENPSRGEVSDGPTGRS